MSLTIDHWIFGNGHGLKSPFWDSKFYWLNDGGPGKGHAILYHWIGGFGAQLIGMQWRHPRLNERRVLNGREYVAFQSTRRWIRVEVSWSLVRLPQDTDGALALMRMVKSELDAL